MRGFYEPCELTVHFHGPQPTSELYSIQLQNLPGGGRPVLTDTPRQRSIHYHIHHGQRAAETKT